MADTLVYMVYCMAGLGALSLYAGLPKEDQPPRRGLMAILAAFAAGFLAMILHRLAGTSADNIMIYVLSFLALAGAIRVVTHPQPLYSALYFILVVVSTSMLIFAVGATFLGAALVIVYAGAILVTYAFVIMLSQQSLGTSMNYDREAREPLLAVVAGFLLIGTIGGLIVRRPWPIVAQPTEQVVPDNTLALGKMLVSDFTISVELGAVLLLVAMIGAIALAKKRIPQLEDHEAMPLGEIGKHVKPF